MIYVGEFKNFKFNGKGTLTAKAKLGDLTQPSYEGDFVDGDFNGHGKL